MDTNSWPEIAREGPYKASTPKGRTGWVYVMDKDGKAIATCFNPFENEKTFNMGADLASAIAYALNATFPAVTDEEKDAEDAAEADAEQPPAQGKREREMADKMKPEDIPRCSKMDGSTLKIGLAYTEAGWFQEANCITITDGERTALYVPVSVINRTADQADAA